MTDDPLNNLPRCRERMQTYRNDLVLPAYETLTPEAKAVARDALRREIESVGLIPMGGNLEDYG